MRAIRQSLSDSVLAFRAVFGNRNLRLVELTWAGSVISFWAAMIALAVYAYDVGGAAAVGILGFVRMLPSIVAAPFLAALGDRYRRGLVLLVSGLGRTLVMGLTAFALFTDAPTIVIYALATAVTLLFAIVRPTQSAMLPSLSRSPEELTAANVVLTTIEGAAIFLGPAVGGALLSLTTPDVVFAVMTGVSLVSVLALALVREPTREVTPGRKGRLAQLFGGFAAIGQDANLRLIVALYGSQTLVAGALNVLIVVAAIELLDAGESGVGFLNAAVGIGGIVAACAAVALAARGRLASDVGVGLVLYGLPLVILGLIPNVALGLFALALVGAGITIIDVAAVTLMQRTVPDEVLSRVFGVLQSVFVATVALGSILAPVAIETLGNRGALIATGALTPLLVVLTWRRLSRLDAEATAPTREVDLLREVPMLRPLAPATLEQLAASAATVRFAAGEEIFRQGDHGDRFYVVADGAVDVVSDGEHLATAERGGYFGEIAVLRDVPRTATVRAKTDVELLALDRDEFLAAVTGHASSAEVADSVVAERLAGLRPGVASV